MSTLNKIVYYDTLTVSKLKVGNISNQLIIQNKTNKNTNEPIILDINKLVDTESNNEIFNKTIDTDVDSDNKNIIKNLGPSNFKPVYPGQSIIVLNEKGGNLLTIPKSNSILYYDYDNNQISWLPITQLNVNTNNTNNISPVFNLVGHWILSQSLIDKSDKNQTIMTNLNNYNSIFDSNTHFEIPYKSYNNMESFSVSLFLFLKNYNCLIIKNSTENFKGFIIELEHNKLVLKFGDGIKWNIAVTNSILDLNIWYNIILLSDGITLKLYLNGGMIYKTISTLIPNDSEKIIIGNNNIITNGLSGYIDEIRIYDGVINAKTIEDINISNIPDLTEPEPEPDLQINLDSDIELEPEPEPELVLPNYIILILIDYKSSNYHNLLSEHKLEINNIITNSINTLYTDYNIKISYINNNFITIRCEMKINDYAIINKQTTINTITTNLNKISNQLKYIFGGIDSITEATYNYDVTYQSYEMEPEPIYINQKLLNPTYVPIISQDFNNIVKIVRYNGQFYMLYDSGKIYLNNTIFIDISSTKLIDLLFHPNYSNNNLVYIYYIQNDTAILCQYKVNNQILDLNTKLIIYQIELKGNTTCACFDDKHLYLCIGDTDGVNAQNLSSYYGKILKFEIVKQTATVSIDIGNTKINHKHIVDNLITVNDINNWMPNSNYSKNYNLLDSDFGHSHQFTVDSNTFERIKNNSGSWPIVLTSTTSNNHNHNINIFIMNYQVLELSLFIFNASIGSNHNHIWDEQNQPTIDDINGTTDKTYTIHSNEHSHSITLTSSDFAKLRKGDSITKNIEGIGHTHNIDIVLTNRSILKIDCLIQLEVSKSDIGTSHNHVLDILYQDLKSNTNYTISDSTHNHTFSLTQQNIIELKNGKIIYPKISINNNHSHQVKIQLTNIQNYQSNNNIPNALPEIYAYGLEEPNSVSFHNNKLYCLDNNKILDIKSGTNYGWKNTIELPIFVNDVKLKSLYFDINNNMISDTNNKIIFLSDKLYYLDNGYKVLLDTDEIQDIIDIVYDTELYIISKKCIYKVFIGKYNPINSFLKITSNNLLVSGRILGKTYLDDNSDDNLLPYLNTYLDSTHSNLLIDTNSVPNYIPKFRDQLLLGNWSNNNFITYQNYGWINNSIKMGNPIKIPITQKPYNNSKISNNQAIGISINGILLYKLDYLESITDQIGGSPNNLNIYNYSKYIGFLENNQIQNEHDIINYLNNKLKLLGPSGHSKILGYAFDGYPIYGPIGFDYVDSNSSISDIYSKKVKLMVSSYKIKDNKPKFIINSGDLDICNGVYSPTPEYPEGIYHYHMTIDTNTDGTTKTISNPYYSGLNEIDGNQVISPAYPYILSQFYGQPDVENFNLSNLSVSYTKYINSVNNTIDIKYKENKLYILENNQKILVYEYSNNSIVDTSAIFIENMGVIVGFDFHPKYINIIYLSILDNDYNNILEYNYQTKESRIIYSIKSYSTSNNIKFGPDGYLYISTRDVGFTSQDLNKYYGKVLRINIDNTHNISNNILYDFKYNNGYIVNNDNNPTLTLYRGNRYIFSYDNSLQYYPIDIYTKENSIYLPIQSNYTNDTGYNFDFSFIVPLDCPDVLYYKCRTNNIFGAINIKSLYQIPNTNPFLNNDTYKKEIIAYGFRNPKHLFFDKLPPRTEYPNEKRPYRLFVSDIGNELDNSTNEVNVILPFIDDIKNMGLTLDKDNHNVYSLDEVTNEKYLNYGWEYKSGNEIYDKTLLEKKYNNNLTQYNNKLNSLIDPIYKLNETIIGGLFYRNINSILDNKYIILTKMGVFYISNLNGWKLGRIDILNDVKITNIFIGLNKELLVSTKDDILILS